MRIIFGKAEIFAKCDWSTHETIGNQPVSTLVSEEKLKHLSNNLVITDREGAESRKKTITSPIIGEVVRASNDPVVAITFPQ